MRSRLRRFKENATAYGKASLSGFFAMGFGEAFLNLPVPDIANKVLKPFGISPINDMPTPPFLNGLISGGLTGALAPILFLKSEVNSRTCIKLTAFLLTSPIMLQALSVYLTGLMVDQKESYEKTLSAYVLGNAVEKASLVFLVALVTLVRRACSREDLNAEHVPAIMEDHAFPEIEIQIEGVPFQSRQITPQGELSPAPYHELQPGLERAEGYTTPSPGRQQI